MMKRFLLISLICALAVTGSAILYWRTSISADLNDGQYSYTNLSNVVMSPGAMQFSFIEPVTCTVSVFKVGFGVVKRSTVTAATNLTYTSDEFVGHYFTKDQILRITQNSGTNCTACINLEEDR